ncbi:hypothetical protein PM082_007645 [Marasmius tenuissimus]|nr:hypothetical protein PM082_007645 [Marasmius tenuissimus]
MSQTSEEALFDDYPRFHQRKLMTPWSATELCTVKTVITKIVLVLTRSSSEIGCDEVISLSRLRLSRPVVLCSPYPSSSQSSRDPIDVACRHNTAVSIDLNGRCELFS